MPRRQEPGQRLLTDRLDLATAPGQRPPAELLQHVDVAPLPLDPDRAELAPHEPALRLEARERTRHPVDRQTEPPGHLVSVERAVSPGEPGDELLEGALDRLGEGGR